MFICFWLAGSSLLCGLSCACGDGGLLCICGVRALNCGGVSCCGARALEHRLNSCGDGLSCPEACGIFPTQGWKLQAGSLPLSRQGSPTGCFGTVRRGTKSLWVFWGLSRGETPWGWGEHTLSRMPSVNGSAPAQL